MATALRTSVVALLCLGFVSALSADDPDDEECLSYTDSYNVFHNSQRCLGGYCCGTCESRYCCYDRYKSLSEDDQNNCGTYERPPNGGNKINSTLPIALSVSGCIIVILIIICCFVCPCCVIYKRCRKPQPVIATTHTTVTTARPYYPQQASAVPSPAQGGQYPTYHHMPVQPGMGMYPGQQPSRGPPPSYQEATFTPGQQMYPIQPPPQQPTASSSRDFSPQPAYNPDFVPPPKTR
ncbi:protein shisa-4-like [Neosynchiropus ocellatus]